MPIYHIYCSYWCNTAYFLTFPGVTIVKCSKKYLFLKYGRKIRRAKFLEMLEVAIFFRGFPVLMASSLRLVLQTYSEICIFCSVIQYSVEETASVKCTRSVDGIFGNCL